MLAGIGNAIAPVFAPLDLATGSPPSRRSPALRPRKTSWQRWASCNGIADATEESVALLASVAGTFTVASVLLHGIQPFCVLLLRSDRCDQARNGQCEMDTWAAIGYQTLSRMWSRSSSSSLAAYSFSGSPFGVGAVIAVAIDRPYCMADGTQRLRPVEEEGNAFRCGSKSIKKTD